MEDIHKSLVKAINRLNKYTHIGPDTMDVAKEQGDALVQDTLESFSAFLATINECKKTISDSMWSEIDKAIVNEVLADTISEIDALATHHFIDEICTNSIVVSSIDNEYVYFVADGSLGCELQYGSNSDIRKGDGAEFSGSFPFTCELVSPVADPETIEFVAGSLEVDLTSWYGED